MAPHRKGSQPVMSAPMPDTQPKPRVAHERVGDFLLMTHPHGDPTEAEWDEAVAAIRKAADSGARGLLVHTIGGGPNAAQRKQVAEMWEARGSMITIAVTTPSSMVRGVITALNWFLSRPIRAFATLEESMDYLDVPRVDRAEVVDVMQRLMRVVD